MKTKLLFSFVLLVIFSCNRLSYPYGFSTTDQRSLTLISDTTLNYSIRFGGLGIATTIKYKIVDSLLIIDSVDIYGRRSFQEITTDVFNHEYIFSKDSLVDIENKEKFFGNKYFNSIKTNRDKKQVYIIFNNEKLRINRYNFKRIFQEIDTTKQEIVVAEPSIRKKFEIKSEAIVYKVVEK